MKKTDFSSILANIAKMPEFSAGNIKEAASLISREACIALGSSRVSIWVTKLLQKIYTKHQCNV